MNQDNFLELLRERQDMSEPTRIAVVMGKMNGGGVETVVMNYYRNMDRQNYQFHFLVDADSVRIPEKEILSLGGKVIKLPSMRRPFLWARSFAQVLDSDRYLVVHSHRNALSSIVLGVARAKGVGVRIAHSHSTASKQDISNYLIKTALRPFSRINPTHCIACSQHAGDWLYGKKSDYMVIPNAVSLSKYTYSQDLREAVREHYTIPSDAYVIGTVGRLCKQKNQRFLLDLIQRLKPHIDAVCLVIAGEGPLKEQLYSRANRLGVSDRVHFVGHRDDMQSIYSAFDVFCLPSLYEGLPLVGVEAQAAALPCIFSSSVSREVRLSEMVEFLPTKGGIEMWSDAILRLWEKRGTSKRIEAVVDRRLEQFEITRTANMLETVYQRALSTYYHKGA